MTNQIIISALAIALIYLYYQNRKLKGLPSERIFVGTDASALSTISELEELKSKLGEKTLDEILEQNEDYETEVDTLTRTKNSLEQDLQAQSTAFQNRLREKDRELKKLKEDFTNLEQQVQRTKSSLPGEFPKEDFTKTHQEQLRKINSLFDDNANNYPQIDFNGLYKLLEEVAQEQKKKKNSRASSPEKK